MTQHRVFRTSSFRLALVYATLTGVSFLILSTIIFLSTTRFMRHQIDDSVASEIDEILADSRSGGRDAVQAAVERLSQHPSGFHYLFQDAHAMVLAGNLPATEPTLGVREWKHTSQAERTAFSAIRGRGVSVSGSYLFVGWSTHQLLEMEELVVRTFAWGLAASIGLALAGGLVMSGRLMRRIESVSMSSRSIIGEDLRQRLPITRSDDEIDHLAASFNVMLDRIQGLMSNLRQVTTDIAHDLRTPLTRLRQRLEMASQSGTEVSVAHEMLNSAVIEIDSILAIFSALLGIAQIESGTLSSGFKVVDLTALLSTIVEIYQPMAEENGQTMHLNLACSLTTLGNQELLMQLFANLIENALRHTPSGSQIDIEAGRDDEGVVVSVTDNGPGVPEPLREKVIQRFYRLDTSRTTVGHGLGLSLASAIAKAHHATIELGNARPGLRVTVRLLFAAEENSSDRLSESAALEVLPGNQILVSHK